MSKIYKKNIIKESSLNFHYNTCLEHMYVTKLEQNSLMLKIR